MRGAAVLNSWLAPSGLDGSLRIQYCFAPLSLLNCLLLPVSPCCFNMRVWLYRSVSTCLHTPRPRSAATSFANLLG